MNLAECLLAIAGPAARWSLNDFESELQNNNSRSYYQVDPGGVTNGFVLYRIYPDGIEIMNLAVAEKGQGQGTRLMREFLQQLPALVEFGAMEVRLEVSSLNLAALQLYLKTGFLEYNRRRAYYRDGSDAVLMKLTITKLD